MALLAHLAAVAAAVVVVVFRRWVVALAAALAAWRVLLLVGSGLAAVAAAARRRAEQGPVVSLFLNGIDMQNFALVKAGQVINVIAADAEFIAAHGEEIADGGKWFDVSDDVLAGEQRPGPGDEIGKRGVLFVKPEPVQDAPGL